MRILGLLAVLALVITMAAAQDENVPQEQPEPRPVPPVITSMQVPVRVILPTCSPMVLRLRFGWSEGSKPKK